MSFKDFRVGQKVSIYNHLQETYTIDSIVENKRFFLKSGDKSRKIGPGILVCAEKSLNYSIGERVNLPNKRLSSIITGYTITNNNERAYVLDYSLLPFFDSEIEGKVKERFEWIDKTRIDDPVYLLYLNAVRWRKSREDVKIRGKYYVVYDEGLSEWHVMLNTRRYTRIPGVVYFTQMKNAQEFADELNERGVNPWTPS